MIYCHLQFKHDATTQQAVRRGVQLSLPPDVPGGRWATLALDLAAAVQLATATPLDYLAGVELGGALCVRGAFASLHRFGARQVSRPGLGFRV